VIILYLRLSKENTINGIKANKIKELENQIALITDGKRETLNNKKVLDEKEKETKNLKAKLKIPHFQFT
jgi:type II secretory pathway component PulC